MLMLLNNLEKSPFRKRKPLEWLTLYLQNICRAHPALATATFWLEYKKKKKLNLVGTDFTVLSNPFGDNALFHQSHANASTNVNQLS